MSSLIFYTDESQALVATDTLVVDAEYKRPKTFCSKAFYIPHINTIIASTGLAGFADYWCAFTNSNLTMVDVESLSTQAKPCLMQLFEWYNLQISNSVNLSVTIYHFGFSEKNRKIKAYAHRSENNFEPELLEYGTATKPPCMLPQGEYKLIDIIPSLMEKQREEQQALPEEKRVYIGGEIFALHLTDKGCWSSKTHQFKDFQQDKDYIKSNNKN